LKRLRRSMVIIPGNVPEYLDKCRRLEADVLVFDIQDAIAKLDAAKLQAREMTVNAIAAGGFRAGEICVRVNSPASPWFVEDIKAVADAGADSIMLSHAYSASDVTLAEGCLYSFAPARKVEILIEVDTPGILADLDTVARTSTAVTSLSVAAYDFALELGARLFGPEATTSEDWLTYCRARVLAVARWKEWNAGDLVSISAPGADTSMQAMRASRGMGFDGVTLIFPRLIPMANEVFGVSAEELSWAQTLVDEWNKLDGGPEWNKGARSINGQLVFAPTYEYARRVLKHYAVISGDAEATNHFRRFGLASDEYLLEKRAR
jgi:citrate lyase subunit beta/citryl-CoA lyase